MKWNFIIANESPNKNREKTHKKLVLSKLYTSIEVADRLKGILFMSI